MKSRSLPAHLYVLEDSYGTRIGSLQVDAGGSDLFFDEQMRPRNEYGPAYDPAPRSDAWRRSGACNDSPRL